MKRRYINYNEETKRIIFAGHYSNDPWITDWSHNSGTSRTVYLKKIKRVFFIDDDYEKDGIELI